MLFKQQDTRSRIRRINRETILIIIIIRYDYRIRRAQYNFACKTAELEKEGEKRSSVTELSRDLTSLNPVFNYTIRKNARDACS